MKLTSIFRIFLALLLSVFFVATAGAEIDADSLVRQYDDGRTYVLSPSVDVSGTFNNDTMTVSAGTARDIVTSASTDVITFGSKGADSKISDSRTEYSTGFQTLIPDGTMSIGYIQSDENDYHSKTVTAGATREFFTKNTVVGFGFSNGNDQILSSSNKAFDERMQNSVYSLSLSQILSKVSLIQILYDFRVENGYLASPYRRAKFDDGLGTPTSITAKDENHPRTRNRNAFAVKYNHYLENWATSFATTYRFYNDSWGVTSHTAEERVTKDLSSIWSVSLLFRYYMQSKANFYQAYYTDTAAVFYSGNNTLATYHSFLIGLRPTYTLNDRVSFYLKLEAYEENFSDAVDAYSLSTKTDDKPLAISAKVIGLGVSARF